MPQTYPYLVFTDGSTTVTLQDGAGGVSNWPLQQGGWAPAIAAFNPSALAGRGQYKEVIEEFNISIRGATAAACYTNLDTLARLLDQAERFYYGERVNAVTLRCAAQGSTISTTAAPLRSTVLGRAPGDETSGVKLSVQWNEIGLFYEIANVKVRVWRRALWLMPSAMGNSSASVNNGSLVTTALAAAINTLGPTKITMSNYPSAATDKGFLVVSSNDGFSHIAQADPSSGTAVAWTSVNDAANFARNTNVLRYTPTGTTESTSGSFTISPTALGPLWAVFVNLRNNSNTTNFQVRMQVLVSGSYISAYTPLNYVAPYTSAATPGWVNLGFISLPLAPATLRLLATASAAAGTIDFGDVLLVDAQYAGTYILTYAPSESNALVKSVVIDHGLLDYAAPTTLGTYPFTVEGDMVVMTKDQNIVCANLITSGSANDWRQTFGGAVTTNSFTLTRDTAYLAPI